MSEENSANPIVVIFTDNDAIGVPAQYISERELCNEWPGIQVKYLQDPKEFEDKMREWGESVQGVVVDVRDKDENEVGIEFAENIRKGAYGNRKDIPILLYSMDDFTPPRLMPPARISMGEYLRSEMFIEFFRECKENGAEYKQPDLQSIRDKAAGKLLEFLRQPNADLQSKIEFAVPHKKAGAPDTVGTMSDKDIDSMLTTTVDLIRHHTNIAFGGGAPKTSLLFALYETLGDDTNLYFPDDKHYNQYALVRGELMGKVRTALGKERTP